ncbi:hypothetical protein C8J57DRAFT_1714170 [Mycena rebaudengoi]|nr:hypothetical protein C8J57DRAFT_1714170 [Mycena rebaudengoi]
MSAMDASTSGLRTARLAGALPLASGSANPEPRRRHSVPRPRRRLAYLGEQTSSYVWEDEMPPTDDSRSGSSLLVAFSAQLLCIYEVILVSTKILSKDGTIRTYLAVRVFPPSALANALFGGGGPICPSWSPVCCGTFLSVASTARRSDSGEPRDLHSYKSSERRLRI